MEMPALQIEEKEDFLPSRQLTRLFMVTLASNLSITHSRSNIILKSILSKDAQNGKSSRRKGQIFNSY